MDKQRNSIAYTVLVSMILALSLLLYGCMGNTEEGSDLIANEGINTDSIEKVLESDITVNPDVQFVPVKRYDNDGLAAFAYSEINTSEEEKSVLLYYDFSSMTYIEIPVFGIQRTSDVLAMTYSFPIIINSKIYVFQHRYNSLPTFHTIDKNIPNNVFIYDLETGNARTEKLPDEFFFQPINRYTETNGENIRIYGCMEKADGTLQDCMFEIELDDLSVIKVEESGEIYDMGYSTKFVSGNLGSYQFKSCDGSAIYGFAVESNKEDEDGVRHALYRLGWNTGEPEMISDEIFPAGYWTMEYAFVVDGQYVYYKGVNSDKHTIANFALRLSDGQITMIKEMDSGDPKFFHVIGVAEDKLLLFNYPGSDAEQSIPPDSFAVVNRQDYLSGEYELGFFMSEKGD